MFNEHDCTCIWSRYSYRMRCQRYLIVACCFFVTGVVVVFCHPSEADRRGLSSPHEARPCGHGGRRSLDFSRIQRAHHRSCMRKSKERSPVSSGFRPFVLSLGKSSPRIHALPFSSAGRPDFLALSWMWAPLTPIGGG